MQNICGACEVVLPKLIPDLAQAGEKLSLVLDPPRKGCDYKVLKAVMDSGIERIVYVSCNPATLARDVGILTGTLKMQPTGEIVKDIEYFEKLAQAGVLKNGLLPMFNGVEYDSIRTGDEQPATLMDGKQLSKSEGYVFDEAKLLGALKEGSYRVTYMQSYDMFAMTKHVETVVCLERNKN